MKSTALLLSAALLGSAPIDAATLLSADFDDDAGGFAYCDDPFLDTNLPDFAFGERTNEGGFGNSGALQVQLYNARAGQTVGASGGWCRPMELAEAADEVRISLRYRLQIGQRLIYDEYSRLLVSVDGQLIGRGSKAYVDHLGGSAHDNTILDPFMPDTDWQQVDLFIGHLDAGPHVWKIGVYNNKAASAQAPTNLLIDDVSITSDNPPRAASAPRVLVDRLDLEKYKSNIETIASFGDRLWLSPSFAGAQQWVAEQLTGFGYEVRYHLSVHNSEPVSNVYVTKVGASQPDRMYIVSAHLDGQGGGGGADDDGSGVALLLEIARVLASPDVETGASIRIIFWDDEEWGNWGARNYVTDRGPLQGIEDPPGSGEYPEPLWVGMIQHDMLLYDHGVRPVAAEQSPFADMDVEWDHNASRAETARALALAWHHWAGEYASSYPSTAYDESSSTDDGAFRDQVASISVRENRRLAYEEYANPNWHEVTDVYSAYSQKDFELGFNAVQATLGTVATLATTRILDEIFRDGFEATTP